MENKIQFYGLFIVFFLVFGLVFAEFFRIENKLFASENSNTIYIGTAQELADFSALVNNKDTYETYSSATVELTADIDLSSTNFIPIGTNANKFMGKFFGNNHTISGMKVADNSLNGLFGAIENAQISDLVIYISASPSTTNGTKYYGGLTGLANGGLIENCAFYFEINGDFSANTVYLGGIIGRNSSSADSPVTISNCATYINTTENFTINEKSYFDAIYNIGSSADIKNSIFYCETNKLKPYDSTAPNLNNTIITSNNDTADYSAKLGENFVYCTNCSKMELSSNACEIATTPEITPQLTVTEYVYSATTPELEFAEISKANENDDVYFDYTVSGIDAGTQTAYITLKGADADKYALTTSELTFQILPRPIEIEIENTSSIYGDDIKNINYSIKNAINSENIAIYFDFVNENQNSLYNAGEYVIIPKTDNKNYKITTYNKATYTITKRVVDIANTEFTKVFDNTPLTPDIELTNILDIDKTDIIYTFLDSLPTNSGNYTVKIDLCDNLLANYQLAQNTLSLHITPRETSLVWSENKLTFNNTIQYPTATLNLDIYYPAPEINYTGGGSTAEKHSVTVNIDDKNLLITNTTKNYEISPYPLTVQWNNDKNLVFDGTMQCISFAYYLPFKYNFTYSIDGGGINAGTYTAKIITQDINISILNSECEFVIKPLSVEVQWANTVTTFCGKQQSPTYTLDYTLDYDFVITNNFNFTDAGTYTAKLQTADKNINLVNAECAFTINALNVDVIWSDTETTFNNSKQSPKYSLDYVLDYEFEITNNFDFTNVGTYTAEIQTTDKNINLLHSTTNFVIKPFTITLEWTQITHIFDNQIFLPQANFTLPFAYEPEIQFSGAAINVGDYTATAQTDDKNIILENATINYKITPREIALSWGSSSYQYTGYIIIPTYTYQDFEYSFEITLDASNIDVGSYTVTAFCTNKNISLTNATFSYNIYPRDCTVIWGKDTLQYNGQTQAPAFSLEYDSENLNPTCLPIVYVSGGALNIGSYTATACIDSKNFNLKNTTCNFEILANSVESETFPLEIKGEILGTTQIDVQTVTDVAENLPSEYSLIFAINISAQNTTQNNGSMQIEMALMPNLNSDFKILKFDDGFAEVDYIVSNGRIIFNTDNLGTFCFVITASETQNLLPYIIPCAAVLLIAIITIIVIHHRNHKVVFKANSNQKN